MPAIPPLIAAADRARSVPDATGPRAPGSSSGGDGGSVETGERRVCGTSGVDGTGSVGGPAALAGGGGMGGATTGGRVGTTGVGAGDMCAPLPALLPLRPFPEDFSAAWESSRSATAGGSRVGTSSPRWLAIARRWSALQVALQ